MAEEHAPNRAPGWIRDGLEPAGTDSEHYSLGELEALADARRRDPAWALPEHLAVCPLCLESFELIRDGLASVPDRALDRYAELFEPAPAPVRVAAWRRPRWWGPRLAAMIGLIFAIFAAVAGYERATSPGLASGALVDPGSDPIEAGGAMPAGEVLRAERDSSTRFADGSRLRVTAGTRFAARDGLLGGATVSLTAGEVEAFVAPQSPRGGFTVETPIGTATALGTRFRVRCHREEARVHRGGDNGPTTGTSYRTTVLRVEVAVVEGRVRLDNGHDAARVEAGEEAVLREGQPLIEVREQAP